ncbi:MAG TPA: tetratricopeptide repeat protein [Candidatus Bathyarchaeia archaeon]|nr:tetratricopeptide repeat protein [Candidatus Bathyarchaeia archaeon]
MAPRWLVFIAFVVTAPSLTLAAQGPALPALPELALEKLPEGVRSQVKQAYDETLKNPSNAPANGKLGMVLHASDLKAEAEVCYRRAHLLDPKSFAWSYYLGLIQADQGEFQEASGALREALRQNPKYLPAELLLGECLLASGKWQEAAQFYGAMVSRHPDRAEAYYGLGRVNAVRNSLHSAVDSFLEACKLFPKFGPAHYGLAQAYKRIGKADLALEQLALYEKSATLMPDVNDPLLGNVKALSANTRDELEQAMGLAKAGRFDDAAEILEKLLEKNPRFADAHVKLIAIYAQLGQPQKAEGHFQAAVRLHPQDPESYFDRGLLLASQENFVEAEAAFRKVLAIDPQHRDAQLNLGSMLEAQGKLPEAMSQYQRVLDINPEDAQAHFGLGRILVNQEDYKQGIEHLLKSARTGGEVSQPTYLYALGAAYARSGDTVSARHYLKQARDKALALGQSQLVESIEADLRALETSGSQE